MWPKDGAASILRIETRLNMLLECVVGAALRRGAPEVAAPGIVLEEGAIPGFDRIGRIGEDNVKGLEP